MIVSFTNTQKLFHFHLFLAQLILHIFSRIIDHHHHHHQHLPSSRVCVVIWRCKWRNEKSWIINGSLTQLELIIFFWKWAFYSSFFLLVHLWHTKEWKTKFIASRLAKSKITNSLEENFAVIIILFHFQQCIASNRSECYNWKHKFIRSS